MSQSKSTFETLGFAWDSNVVPKANKHSTKRAVFRYKQMLPQSVFEASTLEGNPFTFPEVKTLLDGVSVGGRRLSDTQQVLNLASAANALFDTVLDERFRLDKAHFDRMHTRVAREEALEWGLFRGEGHEVDYTPDVLLGEHGIHKPMPTRKGAQGLLRLFHAGVETLETQISNPLERGMAFFLFGALHQFYFDGNKRTSRFMMNGVLMSHGIDALSVPARRAQAFNEKMVRFYLDRDGTEMMAFLADCAPDNAPEPDSM